MFISYSRGEDSKFAEDLARLLDRTVGGVFFDGDQGPGPWEPDLLQKLSESSVAVVFLCNAYFDKRRKARTEGDAIERRYLDRTIEVIPLLTSPFVGSPFSFAAEANWANLVEAGRTLALGEIRDDRTKYDATLNKVVRFVDDALERRRRTEARAMPVATGATPRVGPVAHRLWSDTTIQSRRYRVLHDGARLALKAPTPFSAPAPKAGSVVTDASGRVAAHLKGGLLELAWMNRFEPLLTPWEQGIKLDGLQSGRLLAIAMIGDCGVEVAVATASQMRRLRIVRPRRGPAEAESVATTRAARDATFEGPTCHVVANDGTLPSSLTHLGLTSIAYLDCAQTKAGRVLAAAGTDTHGAKLVILSDRLGTVTARLGEVPQGVAVVRHGSPNNCVLVTEGEMLIEHGFSIDTIGSDNR